MKDQTFATSRATVDKINNEHEFKLTQEEVEFIVRNWITTQSQHLSTVGLGFDTDMGVVANVIIDKESIFKHF